MWLIMWSIRLQDEYYNLILWRFHNFDFIFYYALSRFQNSKRLWNQKEYEDRRKLQAEQSQDIGTFFETKCKTNWYQ